MCDSSSIYIRTQTHTSTGSFLLWHFCSRRHLNFEFILVIVCHFLHPLSLLLYIYLSIYLSIYDSIYLSLSLYPFFFLSIYLPTYLPNLSVCLSVCLSICLSIYTRTYTYFTSKTTIRAADQCNTSWSNSCCSVAAVLSCALQDVTGFCSVSIRLLLSWSQLLHLMLNNNLGSK